MADRATILIPDVTGYTEFVSQTALVHSAHVVSELLGVLAESNRADLTLAEIEGDALLFFRKGKPLPPETLVEQCLAMFTAFHERIKIIERDTVCLCGACQTVSNLGLKFVVHFGTIREVTVARFTKPAGLDMIIAHRLLKNGVAAREYILASRAYVASLSGAGWPGGLAWRRGRETYPGLGTVEYEVAALDGIRASLPDPPKRDTPVVELGVDSLEAEIDATLSEVYAELIDIDARAEWMIGMEKIERDELTERVGLRHDCIFQGMTIEFTTISTEIRTDAVTYIEDGHIRELEMTYRDFYLLKALAPARTAITFNVRWRTPPQPPPEFVQQFMDGSKVNFERFKNFCEARAADRKTRADLPA